MYKYPDASIQSRPPQSDERVHPADTDATDPATGMARPGWDSLFGCFGSSSKKKGKGGKKKKKVAAAAAGSGSGSGRPRSSSLQRRMSFTELSQSGGGMVSPEDLSLSLAGSNLHVFTIAELRAVTRDFSMTNFIGEGGFGPVYKGFVDDRTKPGLAPQHVAVKLLDLEGGQGHTEWLTEVFFLGQLRHPHLVKLIGYCYEDEHRLLVYEFMTRGSLEKHLFKKYAASLPWSTRLKIAIGAAKGLAFLHEAEKPVIYRDFKTSNILLDSDYKAKLSDFGLAKDGPEEDETHVSTRVMGTQGYAAPEYIMTGHLTAKSDVYGYGVVLLELLTGRKAVDKARPVREQSLVEWARPYLAADNARRLADRVMDPALAGQYSSRAAHRAAAVAHQCVALNPKARPHMSAVVQALEPLLALDDCVVGPFVYVAPPETTTTAKTAETKAKGDEAAVGGKKGGSAAGRASRGRRRRSSGEGAAAAAVVRPEE